jgi:cytoskeletal protein RodZ
MKLFGRKSQNTDVPADLQQYYNTGPSMGKWVARIGLFVVVLAVLVGAGVWLFNTLSNGTSDEPSQQASNSKQQEEQNKAAENRAKAEEEAKKSQAEAERKQEEAAKKKAEEDAAKQRAAAEANQNQSGSSSTAPAPAQPSQQQPQTQTQTPPATAQTPAPATTSQLPNSGPGTAIAGIFAGATALGTLLHALVLRRRTR